VNFKLFLSIFLNNFKHFLSKFLKALKFHKSEPKVSYMYKNVYRPNTFNTPRRNVMIVIPSVVFIINRQMHFLRIEKKHQKE